MHFTIDRLLAGAASASLQKTAETSARTSTAQQSYRTQIAKDSRTQLSEGEYQLVCEAWYEVARREQKAQQGQIEQQALQVLQRQVHRRNQSESEYTVLRPMSPRAQISFEVPIASPKTPANYYSQEGVS
jgi:hypothetical protein